MTDELQIFEFERDFAASLRCIPMITRMKLDECGIKVSLRQWSRFTREGREWLARAPCEKSEEIAHYRSRLIELIETRADEPVKTLDVDPAPEWADARQVPERVITSVKDHGLAPPSSQQWAGLTPLKRFALFKLTRAGHDNDNFAPAYREFLGE